MTQAPVPEFSFADLIDRELIQSALGEDTDQLFDRAVVVDPHEMTPGVYTGSIGVLLNGGSSQLPLIGDSLMLDFGPLQAGGGGSDGDALPIANLSLAVDPFSLGIQLLPGLGLRFSPDLLTPVDGKEAVVLDLGALVSVMFDEHGIRVTAPRFQLPKCGLGQTGIQLLGGTVTLALWGGTDDPASNALGIDSNFRGVVLQNVGFSLPPGLDDGTSGGTLGSKLIFKIARISRTGFSGTLEVDFAAGEVLSFLGAQLNPETFVVTIEHNSLVTAGLVGTLSLPFFQAPVHVAAGLSDGAWTLSLSGDIADTSVFGALNLQLTGLGIERRDGDTWFKLSGSLRPTLAIPGVVATSAWPSLDLRDVLIDQHGHIKASGGKMALSSQKNFTIGNAFKAKLTHFNFGTDSDGFRYVSLSGEIDLVAGLSMKGVFDDLKLRWKDSQQQLSFKDIEITASEPGVFAIDGRLDFVTSGAGESNPKLSEHGFNGAIKLQLPTAQLELDGQLAVREVDDAGQKYTALFITLDLELPAGIPLFQSGLAVYGFNGLLAWHFGTSLKAYGNDWFQWFLGKAPPGTIGVTQLTKWEVSEPSEGLGAGISIGTMPDAGFSWHARTTFIVLVPGPDLILAGDCNFVSRMSGLKDAVQGAFQLLIAFDGDAETLNAMIAAQVTKDPVITVSGSAKAYFDFRNPPDWYLDLGTKQSPLQAQALKIFSADAYLDLTRNELLMGAQAGFDQTWHFGPLSAHAAAHVGGDVDITRRPQRLTGDAFLNGTLDLQAFGVGVDIGLDATADLDLLVQTSIFQPAYHVHFLIDAELTVNLIVTKKHFDAHIEADWTGGDLTTPNPPPLPLAALSIEHAHSAERWTLALQPQRNPDGLYDGGMPGAEPDDWSSVPEVPPDGLPTLVFAVPIIDATGITQNPPVGMGPITVGNASYQFELSTIEIYEKDASGNWSAFGGSLSGKWSEETTKSRLQLWADTPYFMSRLTQPSNRLADHQARRDGPPCGAISYVPQKTCVQLSGAPHITLLAGGGDYIPPNSHIDGLQLVGATGSWMWMVQGQVLLFPGDRIAFDTPATWISINVYGPPPYPVASSTLHQAVRRRIGAPITRVARTSAKPVAPSPRLSLPADVGVPFVPYDDQGNPIAATTTYNYPSVTLTPERPAASVECVAGVEQVSPYFPVWEVCYITLAEQQKADAADQANAVKQAALSDPSHTQPSIRPIFNPNSRYRVWVQSRAQRGDDIITVFLDAGYFRTGPPPGIGGIDGGTGYPTGGPLKDLSRYMAASVPAADTATPAGAQLEAAYRGYDPAMVFNEGYVNQMYGGFLTLQVVDQNDAPVVADGSFVRASGEKVLTRSSEPVTATTDYFTVAPHQDRFRTLWGTRLGAGCSIMQQYPPDSGIKTPLSPLVALAPRRRYELRAVAGQDGSIVAGVPFLSSRFLTVTHHLQSHPKVIWKQTLPADDALPLGGAPAGVTLPSSVSADEARAFETLWSACGLGIPAPRDTLDITSLTDTSGAIRGLAVTSPEPLPWERISWTPTFASIVLQRPAIPTTAKVIEAGGNPFFVEIMLLDEVDPSGWVLQADGALFYKFGQESIWPSGTVFRVYSGPSGPASTADMQIRTGAAALSAGAQSLMLMAGRSLSDTLQILDQSAYQPAAVSVQRRLDGTAFLLQFVSGGIVQAFPAGDLQLAVSAKRDLNHDPGRLWTRNGEPPSDEVTQLHLMIPPP
jgi:hypothetical protein